jgi:hypothetical protein
MASQQSLNTVQQLYIAYYQRPADSPGHVYWASILDSNGGNISAIDDSFGNSPESQALYGPINSATIGDVIDDIYVALFARVADAAGKQFYIDGFNAGTFTPTSIAYNILVGATGDDAVAVVNKQIVASNTELGDINERISSAVKQQQSIIDDKNISATDKLIVISSLNNTISFSEQRRGTVQQELFQNQQLLSLAENVEVSKIVQAAAASRTTATSRRNAAAIGGLLGLLLGALAASIADPFLQRRNARSKAEATRTT